MRDATSRRLMFDALRAALMAEWAAPKFDGDRVAFVNAQLRSMFSRYDVSDRRFTDKPEVHPEAVRSLPKGHPALVENRSLFPSTVVTVGKDFSDRLLVSGENNRKLGKTILKGTFNGYALFGLSLEERATCPTDCDARAFCYGNGMQMARRHRIGDPDIFFEHLEGEIRRLLIEHPAGVMVRLHVLGDFPSVDYVAFWADMLSEHPLLACYGYTHRLPSAIGGDEIGDAIDALKSQYKERFRVRWSWTKPLPDGAYVIDYVPEGKSISSPGADAVVCPAQTDATACCATCGVCWEWSASGKAVAFIKHGPKSDELAAAKIAMAPAPVNLASPAKAEATSETVRPIQALRFAQKRNPVLSVVPVLRMVPPTTLRVEPAYQRDLSGKSLKLIRRIVGAWDWAKFKPPVCAETGEGLFVIDGQHTAIAAASHPDIKEIPVMVVSADKIERRAEAFVAHNRDRLTMTAAQILYGDATAGREDAIGIVATVEAAGGSIPRLPVNKNYAKPGQVTAVNGLRRFYVTSGASTVDRAIRIAVAAKVTPISATVVAGLRIILTEPRFGDVAGQPNEKIAGALASIKNLEAAAQTAGTETGQSRFRACAALIAEACG